MSRPLCVVGASVAALALLCSPVVAQRASVGVVAGGYVTRDFENRLESRPGPRPPDVVVSDARGYIGGPSLELRLSQTFALGLEALYKPLHYEDAAQFQEDGTVVGFAPNTVVTWQFPVLARYQLQQGNPRPFVEAGPSFRATGNLNRADPSHLGASAGIGFAASIDQLHISPTVRYTRWLDDGSRADVRTKNDQLELLVRLAYVPESSLRPLGERISFGAVLGATLSNDIRPSTTPLLGSRGGTFRVSPAGPAAVVGLATEVLLLKRVSLEANAIPRSFRSVQQSTLPDGTVLPELRTKSGGTWEFPVLVKVRLRRQGLRPFVAAGPSFRMPKLSLPVRGGTIGVGVEVPVGRLKIAPTLRYTRWGSERPLVPGAPDSGVRPDQIRLLATFLF